MPKVKFEFQLPEESEEFNQYNHASNYYIALSEIAEHIRRLIKYENADTVDIEKFRAKFYEILDNNEVYL